MTLDARALPSLEDIRAEQRRRAVERERENGRWRPRDYQLSVWNHMMGGGLRADIAAHRRWGKDDVALNWTLEAAKRRPAVYWHMLPEANQGRKAIWEAINPHTGKRRIDEAFPPEVRSGPPNSTHMQIPLIGGSLWQVVGSDNFNSLVGAPPAGIVFSEWSLAKPDAWAYMRPILAENGGWALFLWTPRGRNHATVAFEARERDPATWFTLRSPATETSVFTADQLAREKAELIAEMGSTEEGEARFASEYLVDFDAATPGAYYATQMREAQLAGRITRVPYDPALKVETAWDLGIDDYTAIWFFQQVGREVRAIDYFETSGEGFQAIVKRAIAEKPYVYGTHHLPHDIMVREMGNAGRSRYETLTGLGMNNIGVGVAQDPEERINAGRQMIPITWFDQEKCGLGIERLRAYRKKWNRATRSYGGPLHDEASHGSDAFGEFAVNRSPLRLPKPRIVNGGGAGLSWMQ